jgi:GLPGLI family protein
MNKTYFLLAILFCLSSIAFGQTENKIIKVSYVGVPLSQYQTPSNSSRPQDEIKASVALKQGYKYHYTLYVNPKSNQSLYKFETLTVNKPKGQEAIELKLNDELAYCVKTSPKTYYKFETIFRRPFYSNGGMKDIEWSITNEKKNMLGFECTKAVAKNKDYLISVWFTDKIPVSSGPANYFGLPGLVVWAEDFFRTTQIEKIEYIDEQQYPLTQEIAKVKTDFDKNKKASEIQEKLFLEKKSELIKSMIAMMK